MPDEEKPPIIFLSSERIYLRLLEPADVERCQQVRFRS